MLKYLIFILDDTSVSFCHYEPRLTEPRLMKLDDLKAGILFAMKQNLNIQYVLPPYPLPADYWQAMLSIDHQIIVSGDIPTSDLLPASPLVSKPQAVVFNSIAALESAHVDADQVAVLRLGKADIFASVGKIADLTKRIARLNLMITDVDTFTDADLDLYKAALSAWRESLTAQYLDGRTPQFNLLTDRMMLTEMNNCGAGIASVALCPDGKFYVCPAFYQAESETTLGATFSVGDPRSGVSVPSQQLYDIEHAPICRMCDAYQCHRCVWLNRKATYEVNTPGHEQCVTSHLERNASRQLLADIRSQATFLPGKPDIPEVAYLDPFDIAADRF